MTFLQTKNNAKSTSTGLDNTDDPVTFSVGAGEGALFPDTADGSFRVTVWSTSYADPADDTDMEILEVTARATDSFTATRAREGTSKVAHSGTVNVALLMTSGLRDELVNAFTPPQNLLKNGNFINNSSDGYGGTPDDWVSSSANPVQGGIPTLTKAQLISILGVADGDIEGLWPLNEASGNALDLSSNGYDLTDTNTVLSSDDGLMAKARDFELDTSEYFTIADGDCPNLEILGSQTWFCWVKAETVAALMNPMLKEAGGVLHRLHIEDTGFVQFFLSGLTTNAYVNSDIIIKAGKWYMLVGVYDSVEEKIKIWINGVKKEVASSGSATDTDGDFFIGTNLAHNRCFDGLIQNAGVLSVALTDDQVKRLWAYTSYKGQKIRRDSTDALLYQDLPQDLVERLRGKTVTLRAKVYAGSTNHRIYIYDGTTTTPASPTAANTWEEISATVAIGATATQIRIGLEADTTNGNMWVKEVALYEGLSLLPYDHSKEDWEKFPALLEMNPPDWAKGYENEGAFIYKVHVLDSANQEIPNDTLTWLSFDTSVYDFGNLHDPGVDETKLVAPVSGTYIIWAFVRFASNATGDRQVLLYINGVAKAPVRFPAGSTGFTGCPISIPFYLAKNDYAQCRVLQDSGGALNVDMGGYEDNTGFGMIKIS